MKNALNRTSNVCRSMRTPFIEKGFSTKTDLVRIPSGRQISRALFQVQTDPEERILNQGTVIVEKGSIVTEFGYVQDVT
jgi:hypothetical protein